jgi:citronellol/citronellal dehydrogenase
MMNIPIRSLKGKTILITGASRGVGLAMRTRAARDGAQVVLVARTVEPHPKLQGTLHSAAAQMEAAGGKALIVQTEVRDNGAITHAVRAAVEKFGGIDVVVNNAGAISMTPTPLTPMKRFDLMFSVNVRGTFACTQACLPALKASAEEGRNPHVLNLSPPLAMQTHWFAPHLAYTIAMYGMSLCTLGHASEFARHGIGVNSLWPRSLIATAALQMIPDVDLRKARTPEILADAAWLILTSDARTITGDFFIDDELLASQGISDCDRYAVTPGTQDLLHDLFVD